MFDQTKIAAEEDFFAAYIRKNKTAYILVLSVVLGFECVMLTRGLILFDLSNFRRQLYLLSYIFLAATTLFSLTVVTLSTRERVSPHTTTLVLHGYCTAIIAWSLLVSYLDLSAGSTAIVYLTVVMSVGGLSVLQPVYYGANVMLSAAILLILARIGDLPYFQSNHGGIYVNLAVYIIISILLGVHHYQISRKDQEMSSYLEQLSYCDQLTGIYNRRMYEDAAAKADQADEDVTVAIFDFDRFKQINDTWGHDLGDQCLKVAAASLRENYGERSYRIGGDEFAAICENADRDALRRKIERVNQSLAESFPDKHVTVSVGYAKRRPAGSVAAALRRADKALYDAKADGTIRCCFADEQETTDGQGEAAQ